MRIVPGSSSPVLSRRIASILGVKLANVTFKRFPDGEIYVRIEDAGDDPVIVQSITSNDDLVTLMLMLDALEGKDVTVVIPYMGYARQDRRFKEGEPISVRAVAKTVEGYAGRIITVNIHSKEASSHFRGLEEVDAMPIIGEHYRGRDVVMISPDLGSLERVKVCAEHAGCEFDYLEKERLDAERVVIKPKNLDVKGRDIVIVDDIISTGGTMVEATKMLLSAGARSVECACVHAVLAGNALHRLFYAGVKGVVATDTIERIVSVVSVAPVIAEMLR